MRGPPHAADAGRLPGLDLVRAVAIAWVMLYHASILWHVPGDSWIVRFGWMGVDPFFVLSGFLIAGQLLRPWARGRPPDYRRFITRRLLRTIPAYLVVLALYFLVPPINSLGLGYRLSSLNCHLVSLMMMRPLLGPGLWEGLCRDGLGDLAPLDVRVKAPGSSTTTLRGMFRKNKR